MKRRVLIAVLFMLTMIVPVMAGDIQTPGTNGVIGTPGYTDPPPTIDPTTNGNITTGVLVPILLAVL